jgi:partner of Y14 and mago
MPAQTAAPITGSSSTAQSSPTTENQPTTSKAGITTDANGVRHIPSSIRADGSVRKEIRIRPGYRPPEDVEVYRNRTAEAFRNRGKNAGVPGAESIEDDTKGGELSGAAGKNAKRREARKRAAAAKADGEGEGGDAAAKNAYGDVVEKKEETKEEIVKDPEAEKEKDAKKLLKKLRQARELKDKKDQGAALLPEQFQKVIRINELIRQLDSLGFNTEGEKKEKPADDT